MQGRLYEIGPHALIVYILSAVQVQNNTLQVLQRTALGPAPPKTCPGAMLKIENYTDLTYPC
jgi:hypothetical protein